MCFDDFVGYNAFFVKISTHYKTDLKCAVAMPLY